VSVRISVVSIKNKADCVGIPCGVHVVAPSEGELYSKLDSGYRFIAYSIDSVFLGQFAIKPNII